KVSDNVDLTGLTSAPSQPIGLSELSLQLVATPTLTPTPNPNSTATPTPTATPTATPTPTPTANPTQHPASNPQPVYTPTYTPTPSPTAQVDLGQVNASAPAPHKVFASPKWDTDHETITINNDGDRPLQVRAWIEDPSDYVATTVNPGASKTISTASIMTQENQVVTVGFDAYDNGAIIDSYKANLALGSTPTPAPETIRSPGFAGILALVCILGAAAYLAAKKGR
ncbi:MAG TPA: hypothetical protein VMC61_04865, partial [Methanocella sp.]|nr:hypothetical protein [Methanocella sp.]